MKHHNHSEKARRKLLQWKRIGRHSPSRCPRCGQRTLFQIDQYDAMCCTACDEWLDAPCGDPDCPFCARRPETPGEALAASAPDGGARKFWRRQNYAHQEQGRQRHRRRKALAERLAECRRPDGRP